MSRSRVPSPDDERHFLDRITYQKKRSFAEVGRRMQELGLLEGDDDFFFLARHELCDLWEGRGSHALCRAKIEARHRVFEKRNAREEHTPPYIQAGQVVPLEKTGDEVEQLDDGALRGMGTSRGQVTGRARGQEHQRNRAGREGRHHDLQRHRSGLDAGIPVDQGIGARDRGMLAHGACLSREYGLPAVKLRHAIQLIDDGAWIKIDSDTGEIHILEEPEPEPGEEARAVA